MTPRISETFHGNLRPMRSFVAREATWFSVARALNVSRGKKIGTRRAFRPDENRGITMGRPNSATARAGASNNAEIVRDHPRWKFFLVLETIESGYGCNHKTET